MQNDNNDRNGLKSFIYKTIKSMVPWLDELRSDDCLERIKVNPLLEALTKGPLQPNLPNNVGPTGMEVTTDLVSFIVRASASLAAQLVPWVS